MYLKRVKLTVIYTMLAYFFSCSIYLVPNNDSYDGGNKDSLKKHHGKKTNGH